MVDASIEKSIHVAARQVSVENLEQALRGYKLLEERFKPYSLDGEEREILLEAAVTVGDDLQSVDNYMSVYNELDKKVGISFSLKSKIRVATSLFIDNYLSATRQVFLAPKE